MAEVRRFETVVDFNGSRANRITNARYNVEVFLRAFARWLHPRPHNIRYGPTLAERVHWHNVFVILKEEHHDQPKQCGGQNEHQSWFKETNPLACEILNKYCWNCHDECRKRNHRGAHVYGKQRHDRGKPWDTDASQQRRQAHRKCCRESNDISKPFASMSR